MILVPFQGKPFNITVIQVYAPTANAKEAQVNQFYKDLEDLLELRPKKKKKPQKCSIHHWGLEYKSRKLRDTWSNKQDQPWRTKCSRAKTK